MRTLAIIGFGAFGRFMVPHVRGRLEVLVHDSADVSDAARELGVRAVDLAEAARAEVIVLAVPVQALGGVSEQLGALIPPGHSPLVVDVSSVKVRPMELMARWLPARCKIVGTHPLFGPQSGKDAIAGLSVALCPGRCDDATLACVREFLSRERGLTIIDTTPDEHDREMAFVQGLTHLLSRALGAMELPDTPMGTLAYGRLLAMRANLASDSWELFVTIENENPHARSVRAKFHAALEQIERRLEDQDR